MNRFKDRAALLIDTAELRVEAPQAPDMTVPWATITVINREGQPCHARTGPEVSIYNAISVPAPIDANQFIMLIDSPTIH